MTGFIKGDVVRLTKAQGLTPERLLLAEEGDTFVVAGFELAAGSQLLTLRATPFQWAAHRFERLKDFRQGDVVRLKATMPQLSRREGERAIVLFPPREGFTAYAVEFGDQDQRFLSPGDIELACTSDGLDIDAPLETTKPKAKSEGWGGHVWKTCKCGEGPCQWCGGGLAMCTICGGFEGSLTSECCGRKLSYEEEQAIYNEGIDFADGAWSQKRGLTVTKRRLILS